MTLIEEENLGMEELHGTGPVAHSFTDEFACWAAKRVLLLVGVFLSAVYLASLWNPNQ